MAYPLEFVYSVCTFDIYIYIYVCVCVCVCVCVYKRTNLRVICVNNT